MNIQGVYNKKLGVMEVTNQGKSPAKFLSIKEIIMRIFYKKSTDPIDILPKKVINKIFGYCSGNDLLDFSLVNRKWYKFVAKSAMCMDKIKIVLAEPRIGCFHLFTLQDAYILTQFGRKYVHITLASMERQLLSQHKFLLAYFEWKTVVLQDHLFKTKMDLINFLGMLEPFVEELTLRNVKHGRSIYKICKPNFRFPRLKTLSIINCYTFLYGDPFCNVKTLRCLILATDAMPNHIVNTNDKLIERVRGIQMILLKNIDITYMELFITQTDFDAIFMDQRFLSRIRFKLQSFYVGRFKQEDNEGINIVQISNFVDFLKSQENTLHILYLDNWLGNATLEYAINDMQLKELTISDLETFGRHNDSIGTLSLYSNDTIEHLTIWTESARHIFLTNEMLKVCRGLKVLEIRTINQQILETIIEYNEDVEIIVCDFFTAYMPPEKSVLRNLRTMIINITCADNFRDLIRYKDGFTNFEMVFLKAAKNLWHKWNMYNRNFYIY